MQQIRQESDQALERPILRPKVTRAVVIVICSLFVALLFSDLWSPCLLGGLTRSAYALLNPDAAADELPQEVRIAMDGSTATFRKGDSDYDTLLRLLRTAHSADDIVAAGPYPSFRSRLRCGELTIPYGLIPFRFPLYRSTSNRDYLWIGLPHLSGLPGTTYPTILDDGRLLQFVQNAARHRTAVTAPQRAL